MFHGWWMVSTHFLGQLFIVGFFSYSYPLIVVPVEEEFGSGMEAISFGMIGCSVIGLVLPLFVGPLVDRWSARWLMLIGAVTTAAGLIGLSFSQNVTQFVIAMAVLIGAANVLLGPIAGSAVISRWFVASRGRALGLASIGTSVGGILMPQFFSWGIDGIGWRAVLQWTALAVVLVVVPLLLFVFRDRPSDAGMEPEGGTAAAEAAAKAGPDQVDSNSEIFGMRDFWIMSVSLALFLSCYTAALSNLPKYAADLGLDGAARAELVTLLASCGLIGKLAFGYLADRVPLKPAFWLAIMLTAAALWTLSEEPSYSWIVFSVSLMGLASGGILPVWGSLVVAIFGVGNFGRTMGLQGPAISLVAMPTIWLAGRLYDSTGNYVLAFQAFTSMLCVAALVLTLLHVPSRNTGEAEG
ncbi:MAG: MFS transporter [Myxococcota bacterium]